MERPQLNFPDNLENYFTSDLLTTIDAVTGNEERKWGIMTVHHMLEHLAFVLTMPLGKLDIKLFTKEEDLPKYQAFLQSNFGLQQNFKFPLLPIDANPPLLTQTLQEAKAVLKDSITAFTNKINEPNFRTALHPFFGYLDKQNWLRFQYKHVMHHFMQFGIA